jgi:hypothetical protein
MPDWHRTVLREDNELAELLRDKIRERWPEAEYPFHIEVIGGKIRMIRVWNGQGIQVAAEVGPEPFIRRLGKNAVVASILDAIHKAVREAVGH